MPDSQLILISIIAITALFSPTFLTAAEPGEEQMSYMRTRGVNAPAAAPDRPDGEGRGPFAKLVIRDVMLVDGKGSPVRGPVSILIEQDRIRSISRGAVDVADDVEIIDGR